MKSFYEDSPSGTFFAVYSDLSAAYLFTQVENNEFVECENGEEVVNRDWFIDAGYLWFFNVDDKFAKFAMEKE